MCHVICNHITNAMRAQEYMDEVKAREGQQEGAKPHDKAQGHHSPPRGKH